ncbi:hypothetical protein FWF89_03765 [Candidatus Saccharibacteria bacterium]|nr:hypothetical protein [Candidatus Saccharibacteria bacterium]
MADTKTASRPTNDILAQVVERVKGGDNVLVALSSNPNVDEMAAAIGLALVLDKLGKHATAIFSGQIPNALVFLQPENTFEPNTNSLQDFIIALSKEKADHLRYKIEGDFVKIFITPYRTTIDEGDLEFSHGDFNVDLVIALNVATPADLDKALSEHGRIMHNAGSINITAGVPGKFGDMEWNNPAASSVSEMVGMLAERLGDGKTELMDTQVATAVLTGIVAATNRFSNEKTTPGTMVMASKLMEKGANQQLISSNIPIDANAIALQSAAASAIAEATQAYPQDPSMLSVNRAESQAAPVETIAAEPQAAPAPDMHGAVDFTPTMPPSSPEQELEGIVQPSSMSSVNGPLMDELRQAATDEASAGELSDNAPKKDYGALIEQELKTPIGEEIPMEEAPDANLAAQAAPAVANNPEINGVPVINYAQAPVDTPVMVAPAGNEPAYINTAPVNVVAPTQAVPVAAPVAAEPITAPLPMPTEGALPPPPPPFDPGTGLTAPAPQPVPAVVIQAPVPVVPQPQPQPVQAAPVVQQQPVMPTVAPIQPAAPVADDHAYLGSNQAMPDQVYPQGRDGDPGAFQLPGATVV